MNQQQQIQIKIDDLTMKGVYANTMSVSHTKEEFLLDFLNIYPAQGAGIATARVIVSPGHFKRIVLAMQDNLKKYEDAHGKIEAAQDPSGNVVGFNG